MNICQGDTTLLWGSGAQSYTWTGGITDSVSFIPSNNQTYVVNGTDSNGCSGTDSIQIIINPLPLPIITFSTDTLFCTNVSNVANYNWTLGGNTIGGNDSLIKITQNGQYIIEVMDSGGCIGYDTIQVINLSSGYTEMSSNNILIYPNPTSGRMIISSDKAIKADVEVLTLVGKRVLTEKINGRKKELDLSQFAKGNYLIRIVSGGNVYIRKITLE